MVPSEHIVSRRSDQLDEAFIKAFSEQNCLDQAYAPGKIQRLLSFLRAKGPALFIVIQEENRWLAKAALFVSPTDPKRAYLGCYEVRAGDDRRRIAHLLLQTARDWAVQQAVDIIYGPVDLNTWFSYRFRSDLDPESFSWEPERNPDALDDWRSFGFENDRIFKSFGYSKFLLVGMRAVSLSLFPTWLWNRCKGYRTVPMQADWQANLPDIYRLGMEAFTGTFLFEPISYEDFHALYQPLGQVYDFSPSFFLVDSSGARIGFILSYYHQGYFVIKSLGIAKAWQGLGLGRSLACTSLGAAASEGYQQGIAALIRAGNRTEATARLVQQLGVTKWVHEYQLLALHLPHASGTKG